MQSLVYQKFNKLVEEGESYIFFLGLHFISFLRPAGTNKFIYIMNCELAFKFMLKVVCLLIWLKGDCETSVL